MIETLKLYSQSFHHQSKACLIHCFQWTRPDTIINACGLMQNLVQTCLTWTKRDLGDLDDLIQFHCDPGVHISLLFLANYMFCTMYLNHRQALPQHNINADNNIHACSHIVR